jgi:hypothetical protein
MLGLLRDGCLLWGPLTCEDIAYQALCREYPIMATKTTYLCDRCGAEVAQTPQSPLATLRVKQTYGDIFGFLHMPDGTVGFECCAECLDALRAWFASGREPTSDTTDGQEKAAAEA